MPSMFFLTDYQYNEKMQVRICRRKCMVPKKKKMSAACEDEGTMNR